MSLNSIMKQFCLPFVGLKKNDNTQKENSSLSTKDTQQLNTKYVT